MHQTDQRVMVGALTTSDGRPYGIAIVNDDIDTGAWMKPGSMYDLAYDGMGWRVTVNSDQFGDHAYRLGTPDGFPIGWLPLSSVISPEGHVHAAAAGGFRLNLDITLGYVIAETDAGTWGLFVR